MTLVGISRQRSRDKRGWSSRSHRSGNSSHKRIVGMTSQIQLAFKMALSVLSSSPEKKTPQNPWTIASRLARRWSFHEWAANNHRWLACHLFHSNASAKAQRPSRGPLEAIWGTPAACSQPVCPSMLFLLSIGLKRHHCRQLVTLCERRSSMKIPKFSVHLCIFFPHKKF